MIDFTTNRHKLFYIKLFSNLLNSSEMDQISMMPDGDMIVLIYIRLLDYARGSKTGILETEINGIHYPDSIRRIKIALKHYSEIAIESSIKILIQFGFMSIHSTGAFVLNNYADIGGAETPDARRMRVSRLKQAPKIEQVTEHCSNNVTKPTIKKPPILHSNIKLSETNNVQNNVQTREEDKNSNSFSLKKESNTTSVVVTELGNAPMKTDDFYKTIIDEFNSTCTKLATVELPELENHYQMIKTLIRRHGVKVEQFKKAFSIVANTPFLTGQNKRGWKPTLTWILQYKNFQKILNGVYEPWTSKVRPGIAERHSEIDRDLIMYANAYGKMDINPLAENIYENVSDEEYFTVIKSLPRVVINEIEKLMEESKKYAKYENRASQ